MRAWTPKWSFLERLATGGIKREITNLSIHTYVDKVQPIHKDATILEVVSNGVERLVINIKYTANMSGFPIDTNNRHNAPDEAFGDYFYQHASEEVAFDLGNVLNDFPRLQDLFFIYPVGSHNGNDKEEAHQETQVLRAHL